MAKITFMVGAETDEGESSELLMTAIRLASQSLDEALRKVADGARVKPSKKRRQTPRRKGQADE